MPVYRLPRTPIVFPPAELADEDGLLAIGGDLSPARLLLAYRSGIFPWYNEGQPILWHSPDPRFALVPSQIHVPRTLRPALNQRRFEVRMDTAFAAVIDACAAQQRPHQRGTWITRGMRKAYLELHRLGWAHSVEAWQGDRLVGGQYGVSIGGAWFGESMFFEVPDASKVTMVVLARWLAMRGCTLIDAQVRTENFARFGAEDWPRETYLARLAAAVALPQIPGPWSIAQDDPAFDLNVALPDTSTAPGLGASA